MKQILTRGNVVVNNLKVGDIIYEFEHGLMVKSKVKTAPKETEGYWGWESVKLDENNQETDEIIDYGVREGFSHYAPNLYDYEAYKGCKLI